MEPTGRGALAARLNTLRPVLTVPSLQQTTGDGAGEAA
jgi:hypothetical protein